MLIVVSQSILVSSFMRADDQLNTRDWKDSESSSNKITTSGIISRLMNYRVRI